MRHRLLSETCRLPIRRMTSAACAKDSRPHSQTMFCFNSAPYTLLSNSHASSKGEKAVSASRTHIIGPFQTAATCLGDHLPSVLSTPLHQRPALLTPLLLAALTLAALHP